MRKLSTEKRAMILSALAEGNGINSTCRICGTCRVTVLRLLADAGAFCADYHDLMVTGLATKRVQLDEVWSFVYAKDRNVRVENWGKGHGSAWVWVALDADSKLAINWTVGGRDAESAREFVSDLASRVSDRIQLTSDGWNNYPDAVDRAFGSEVDFGQLIKTYKQQREREARYSPPAFVGAIKKPMTGNPDFRHISTSYVERQNLSIRMKNRRLTRLTNGFSRRFENHVHAVNLHYFAYNFVHKHSTIKTTPAVAAGVAERELTMRELASMIAAEERIRGCRLTDYLPARAAK